ncbi:DUF3164 family protein [Agrobacterium vitis]|uniref:DUF3164 family protein n=1 Tax=Agrobacterium vitis TaxID=373 RepID=UPI0015749327|nr:DUF3164 family protein [Agrobacterium vitis]NSZ48477.1 DUF3164 family protein [Agrobacterium vitis]UJL73072.1 DUF3164 family protein [Agrobacterium vitis]
MEAVILEDTRDDGVTVISGREWMENARGDLVPIGNIKPEDKLQDETVRKIMKYAVDLSAQIARFRGHTVADLGAFDAILAQEYGAKIGGKKGNRTYQTIDGKMRVVVQVSDQISFGPQLQIAKGLIDECLTEWSAESRPEIQAIVTRAFNTDKEGQINKAELFMLLRLDIGDQRWQRAMDAIRNSITVTGSKEYVRFYMRQSIEDGWQAVTIDLAKA